MFRKNMGNGGGSHQHRGFGGRGGYRGGSRGRAGRSQFSDISKFVNKAVVTENEQPYQVKNTFADFDIDSKIKQNVISAGYVEPTPIQDQSISHILDGKDIVGIANTGTGKTAAFIIPLINKVVKDRRQKVLIMAPTRELAIQINQELMKFAFGLQIYSVGAVGGMPIFRQMSDLRRVHNFVIGTPGRIKDLVERRCINLASFQSVVLDEADRMLDMGFINDMRSIIFALPKNRQTLFFSATLSDDIKKLIGEFLNEPVSVSVKTRDTAKSIDQDVVYVRGKEKLDILHDLLLQPDFNKVLIFGRTKHGVEKLSGLLSARGVKSESIHGNKNHSQRQRALKSFKDNMVRVLVATDVAARGLDIPNVSHVINYELPATHEDYIHRIGRTGRGGKTGKALTFVEGR